MIVFMTGNFQDGFSAVGPFYRQEDLDEWLAGTSAEGFQMEVESPFSKWGNDFVQFPRLLSEMYATVDLNTERVIQPLAESMDLKPKEIMELFERADVVWQHLKLCDACGGPGWLETTEDKIERCDSCERFKNDEQALEAFKRKGAQSDG